MDFDIYKILAGGGFDSPRIIYNKEFVKFANMMNKLAKALDIDKNGHLIIKDKNGKLKLDLNQFIIDSETKPQPTPDPKPTPDPEPEPETCPFDEIWYTTNDNNTITIDENRFNASVISNMYNKKGIIKLSGTLYQIKAHAFEGMNTITSITLPNSVEEIEGACFAMCKNLEKIILSEQLKILETNLFRECKKLYFINIPSELKEIGETCFYNCISLIDIILPNTLQEIGWKSFYNCNNIHNLIIPNTATIHENYSSGTTFKNVQHIEYHGTSTFGKPWGALSMN